MAEKTKQRYDKLQDKFLSKVLIRSSDKNAEKKMLTVFLVNGVKLTGTVADFDEATLLLVREGHSQLIYKHAISTIMPAQSLNLADLAVKE
ncbi:MAG: RNA chaperone Hfq [Candidatus Tokpelaia sp.]|uniref:RNA chaperone Hfq n=1 Tax=Candidatus Tokpelaia sp. TaxID=2233777 RepID=UPI00123B5EE3|nr:RNA chaperone Hfq [Candidatus Tokpelaia sp.]KAA6204800.1 MAG: RNA chaperone Hfq [Candidatus Tokpelaia sp.]KAA6207623.1 MAG: RNA chaperone Hfq [Candidatus Tokpelaia sp.]KAA6404796.1 RNA chaperone Hfq [Candidatus Tokpelaia sp.]